MNSPKIPLCGGRQGPGGDTLEDGLRRGYESGAKEEARGAGQQFVQEAGADEDESGLSDSATLGYCCVSRHGVLQMHQCLLLGEEQDQREKIAITAC